jgi:hypothetical protein
MNNEWIELNSIEDVARAKVEGWDIEVQTDAGNDKYCPWKLWGGAHWFQGHLYRGRPRQQPVVYECYDIDGKLYWFKPPINMPASWTHIPQFDKIVEAEK